MQQMQQMMRPNFPGPAARAMPPGPMGLPGMLPPRAGAPPQPLMPQHPGAPPLPPALMPAAQNSGMPLPRAAPPHLNAQPPLGATIPDERGGKRMRSEPQPTAAVAPAPAPPQQTGAGRTLCNTPAWMTAAPSASTAPPVQPAGLHAPPVPPAPPHPPPAPQAGMHAPQAGMHAPQAGMHAPQAGMHAPPLPPSGLQAPLVSPAGLQAPPVQPAGPYAPPVPAQPAHQGASLPSEPQQPLPPDWVELPIYYNAVTGECSWERPRLVVMAGGRQLGSQM